MGASRSQVLPRLLVKINRLLCGRHSAQCLQRLAAPSSSPSLLVCRAAQGPRPPTDLSACPCPPVPPRSLLRPLPPSWGLPPDLPGRSPALIKRVPTHFMDVLIEKPHPRNFTLTGRGIPLLPKAKAAPCHGRDSFMVHSNPNGSLRFTGNTPSAKPLGHLQRGRQHTLPRPQLPAWPRWRRGWPGGAQEGLGPAAGVSRTGLQGPAGPSCAEGVGVATGSIGSAAPTSRLPLPEPAWESQGRGGPEPLLLIPG